MKNKLHIAILLLVSMILLLSACEKEVQLNVEERDQKLAILCNFSPGEPFNVELTKSISLFSSNSNSNLINDAEVTICSDGYCAPALPDPDATDGISKYRPSDDLIIPETEKEYSISIKLDGFEPISAVSSIPPPAEISHATVGAIDQYYLNEELDSIGYEVRLAFQFMDDPTKENYYQVNFYQILLDTGSVNVIPDLNNTKVLPLEGYYLIDEKLTGNYNLIDGGILFNDLTFQESLQELVFEPYFTFKEGIYKPIEIIMELRTVSKEYYNYYNSVYRQNAQNNVPFSDPTIIHSNVNNGLGIFAGYSTFQFKTDIEL